jgi:hypothetical protein
VLYGCLIQEQDVSGPDIIGEKGAMWLVKPQQTTSVVKFSGTLQHPSQDNKVGKTITAFAHFVFTISKQSLVFADIQGWWFFASLICST